VQPPGRPLQKVVQIEPLAGFAEDVFIKAQHLEDFVQPVIDKLHENLKGVRLPTVARHVIPELVELVVECSQVGPGEVRRVAPGEEWTRNVVPFFSMTLILIPSLSVGDRGIVIACRKTDGGECDFRKRLFAAWRCGPELISVPVRCARRRAGPRLADPREPESRRASQWWDT